MFIGKYFKNNVTVKYFVIFLHNMLYNISFLMTKCYDNLAPGNLL